MYLSVYNHEVVQQLCLDVDFKDDSNPIILVLLKNIVILKAKEFARIETDERNSFGVILEKMQAKEVEDKKEPWEAVKVQEVER